MKQSKNAFVFILVLYHSQNGRFISYAKRVTLLKADNMFCKIVSKGKIIKFETIPIESMSRDDFLKGRKELFAKTKQLNRDFSNDFIVIKNQPLMLFSPKQNSQEKGGDHEITNHMQRSYMHGNMQGKVYSGS